MVNLVIKRGLLENPSFFRCFFLLKLPLIVVFLAFHFTLVSASQKRWEDASKYRNLPRSEVLYLDDSGSMNGANLSEARGALRKMAHLLQDSPTRVCTWLGKTKIIYNIISRFVNCVNILYFYFLKLLHPESYYCRLWYTHIYIFIYIYTYHDKDHAMIEWSIGSREQQVCTGQCIHSICQSNYFSREG